MNTSLSIALILLAALSGQAGAPAAGGSTERAAAILVLLSPGETGSAVRRQYAAILAPQQAQRGPLFAPASSDWSAPAAELSAPAPPALAAACSTPPGALPLASSELPACAPRGP